MSTINGQLYTPEQQKLIDLEAQRGLERVHQAWKNRANQQQAAATKTEKMGLIFFLAMLFVCIIGDVIDFITGGTIGWVIGLFIDLILLVGAGLSRSGRSQFKKIIIGIAGESIPIIAFLPLRSIMLIWSYASSHSEKLSKISSLTSGTVKLAKTSGLDAKYNSILKAAEDSSIVAVRDQELKSRNLRRDAELNDKFNKSWDDKKVA